MRTDRETLQLMAVWLEEGRTALPDHVLDTVLEQLPSKPQRRRWSARRTADMNPIAKFAIAAAAVVVVAIVGYNLLGPAASSQVGGDPSPSPQPSSSPPPLVPTSGGIDPGHYRWTYPGGEVSFLIPDGWTARADGLLEKRADTSTELALLANFPGTRFEVNHVYTDACHSENALEPIGDTVDDLVSALDAQGGTDAVISDISAESVVGQRVEINETPGVDRSQCRHGSEGPLQIWADANETDFFSFPRDNRGVAYVFDIGGNRLVFTAAFGWEVTEADIEEVDAIVRSFEFSSP